MTANATGTQSPKLHLSTSALVEWSSTRSCSILIPSSAFAIPSSAFAIPSSASRYRVLPSWPATAATVDEYRLPRPKAFPHDPAVGRDGIVWYTDQANSYIGRLDPATGQVTDYPTPTQASGPHGIIVAPDGGVWYTGNFKGRLGR